MATVQLPNDFKEFLKLLNARGVEYLVIGGYAVAYHGYPRSTGDLDIWIAIHPENAGKVVDAIKDFGFDVPGLSQDLFLTKDNVVRMGVPPLRIEILTSISGVEFSKCYSNRAKDVLDGIDVPIMGLADLKQNKRAAGRHRDLDDLEHLP